MTYDMYESKYIVILRETHISVWNHITNIILIILLKDKYKQQFKLRLNRIFIIK